MRIWQFEILKVQNKLPPTSVFFPKSESRLIQPAITCSKSTTATLEQGVKYIQS